MAAVVRHSPVLPHFPTGGAARFCVLPPPSARRVILPPVAVFWDMDNKPPREIKPYVAAVRLKLAAARFGPVRFAVAYGDPHAFCRRTSDLDPEPHRCNVCGRRFYNHGKLLNHFKQIHEREHAKRIAKIDSAKGGRRIRMVGELAAKMEKFRRAAAEVHVPKVNGGVIEELRRAGIGVRQVPAAGELRADIAAAVEKKTVGCLVVVSDDGDLAGVLREARTRGLKTVVVGDDRGEGALKRIADVGFSWREVASGKAGKEAPAVIGRWKDGDLLRRLEWAYRPGEEEEEEEDELVRTDRVFRQIFKGIYGVSH